LSRDGTLRGSAVLAPQANGTLDGVNARELERVSALLERKRSRAREAAAAAGACAILAGASAPFILALTVALLVGTAAATLLALGTVVGRRDAIARLALDPSAYALDDVRRYGAGLVRPVQRERLAAWLREIVRESPIPGNIYLTDRVSRYAGQLESLASELSGSWVRVLPASVAACRHLLTHAVESPLYNPAVPAEELPATIERIRRGITR
jgi:hypothetical protein